MKSTKSTKSTKKSARTSKARKSVETAQVDPTPKSRICCEFVRLQTVYQIVSTVYKRHELQPVERCEHTTYVQAASCDSVVAWLQDSNPTMYDLQIRRGELSTGEQLNVWYVRYSTYSGSTYYQHEVQIERMGVLKLSYAD